MLSKNENLQKIINEKLVAVVRGSDAKEAKAIAKGAIEGGIHIIEVTYTTPNASDVLSELREDHILLGAGTVLDSETARHAILKGAQFIVSPNYVPSIATLCNRYTVPYLPGCMTITEMILAMESGSDIIKLFPANHYNASFIFSIKDPLPYLKVMPTGGVNLENIRLWIDAGAVAVGIGSDLTKSYRKLGESGVVELARKYKKLVGD